ncbi:M15 family metallopeptidase [Cellulomonas soli]|uniref:M15 family metallopeptidase n=1 Tax=Cellulomonas soli TaxID=931535 RepID=UPI003F824A26
MLVLVVALAGTATLWAWRVQAADTARAQAVQRAQQQATADAAADDWRVQHEAAASRSRAARTLAQAQQDLTAAVDQAQAVLVATEGQVGDDTVRQALADTLAAAQVPGASVVAVQAQVGSVQAAEAAVTAAHTAWQAEQTAAAARAQASATDEPTTGTSTGGSGAAGSCTTTYTGPAFYTSVPSEGGDGSNGRLPASALSALSWTVDEHGTPFYLATAAAAALERLDGAFLAAFGHHLDVDLTYRDYATQVAMREALGSIAAVPGTSSHGTGLALDVPERPCEYGWDTVQRRWLVANGPSYGWVSPSWARQGGSNPEYWHYEYRG